MIRILVDAIHQVCRKPKFKNMERVAFRVCSRYPDSFKDNVDGIVIGSGIESFTSQLLYRSDNIKRTIKNSATSNEEVDVSFTDEDQQYLKAEYLLVEKNVSNIDLLMKKGYSRQRQDIDQKMLISEIKQNWPFLFEEKYLLAHFEKLMNVQDFKN